LEAVVSKAVEVWNLFVMSDRNYNDRMISRYLLGALSEVETERLDELSVTDDEFAAVLSAAEKELVDSYVQGELNQDDLARFKSHYLASSLRRDKVDFAKALQVFAERGAITSAAGAEGERRASTATKAGWFSALFSNSRPVMQWSFALAAMIFLVAGGLLLVQNNRLRQQVNQTQARRDELQQREIELQKQIENQRTANALTEQELARVREERMRLEEQLRSGKPQPSPDKAVIASLILTPQMRGGEQIMTVTISPKTERVAVRLELEPNEYSTYSVALIDQSGQLLWRSGRIKAAASGNRKSLSVSISATLLRAGMYRIQVLGISPGGASEVVGEYPFRVSR
jgi:hypothetical protein